MFNVGHQLKNYRLQNEKSQIDVFKATGIHNKTLSGYENNVSTPDLDTLRTLLIFYEVSADEFFDITQTKIKNKTDNSQNEILRIYSNLSERNQAALLERGIVLLESQISNAKEENIKSENKMVKKGTA